MKNGFRFKKSMALLLACALALGAAGAVPALAMSSQAANPIVTIVKDTSPAVVNIDVEAVSKRRVSPFPFGDDPIFRQFFGDAFKEYTRSVPMKGRGSGFIVTKDGQILTNNHVVEGADKITVTLADGKTYKARVLGKDPTFDLAVIKIEPKGNLPTLDLGDSDAVEVGEWVVAIGNPYGFEHSVTAGVISAKNRSIHAEDVNFDGLLQTDAAINPGNSGGPLLNMDGRVVGINAAIVPYAQGMGFAIPVNMAKAIMDDLVSYGKVKRGWLGVAVQKLTPEIARAYGVDAENGAIISDVFPDSAAAKAGVKRGDVVVKLNGKDVEDANAFVQSVRTLSPGTTAELGIVRGGRNLTLKVTLDQRPDSADGRSDGRGNAQSSSDVLKEVGLEVAPLSNALRREYRLDKDAEGLVIVGVAQNSMAQNAGIREGDLLIQVNGRNVADLSDLKGAVNGDGKSVVLMVGRDGQTFIVSLNSED